MDCQLLPIVRPYKICIMEIPMKSLWKKEEEREKVKEKEQWEEEILKHVRERMVQEMIVAEDSHPMDTEEDLVVQTSIENLMAWTHLSLTLCSY